MSPHYNFKFVAQIIIKVLCAEQHTRTQTYTHTQTAIECGIQMPQSFQSQFLPHTHTHRQTGVTQIVCNSLPVTDTQTCRYIQKYIAAQPSFLSVIEFFIPCAHQVLTVGRWVVHRE